MSAEVLPVTLSAEELRAAARLAAGHLLPAFTPRWASEELGVADAVALRSLLARGLAEIRPPVDVALTGPAHAALDPLFHPAAVVEAVRETHETQRLVAVQSAAGTTVVAEERQPCLWSLRADPSPAERALSDVVDGWLDHPTVAAQPSVEADSDPDAVGGPLADATTWPADTPGRWELADDGYGLPTGVRARCSVGSVRLHGPSLRVANAVQWMATGDTGIWLVEPDHDEDKHTLTLTRVDAGAVRAALDELFQAPEELR